MNIESIEAILHQIFPDDRIEHQQDVWQINSDRLNLLVVLASDNSSIAFIKKEYSEA